MEDKPKAVKVLLLGAAKLQVKVSLSNMELFSLLVVFPVSKGEEHCLGGGRRACGVAK